MATESNPISVLLAEDHTLVRNGIKSSLHEVSDIEVIWEASNGKEAYEGVRAYHPDVVIMDIKMPEMDGIEGTRKILEEFPETAILVLSMHDNEDYVKGAIDAGASGYVMKDASKDEFVKAIHRVASGKKYFSGEISNVLVESFQQSSEKPSESMPADPTAPENKLTSREKEILKRVVKGMSNKQISEELNISIRTIETHRFNIMKKLGVNSAVEMVSVAVQKQLVNLG